MSLTQMIIPNVPFIDDKEEKYGSCQGPPTVMMAFKFFLPHLKITFEELYEKMRYEKGTWFFETYIAELFYKHSIPSLYHSTEDLKMCKEEKHFKKISGLDFKDSHDLEVFGISRYNKSIFFVLKKSLFKHQKEISIDFIKKRISKSKLIIATINRNKLLNKDGYKGHFILIKGYTNSSLVCNDCFLGEDLNITYDEFYDMFYYIDWNAPSNKSLYSKHLVTIG